MYKTMNKAITLVLASVALSAFAESETNCDRSRIDGFTSCFYIGAGIGAARFDPDRNNTAWAISHKNDIAIQGYGGYHFTRDWFVELAYADLGEVNVKHRNPLIGTKGTISYEVPNIMAGYYLPMDKLMRDFPLDPFIKLGVSSIQNSSSPSIIPYEQQSSAQLALGLGYEWRFAKNWKFRNIFESYDVDAYLFSVSVAYIFGEGKTRPPHQLVIQEKTVAAIEPVPAPVNEKPIEPAPVVLPVEPVQKNVCKVFDGSLEGVVFKVNSDELTSQSKSILLKASVVLKEFSDVKVEIQAHTDSQGSSEYNKALSAKRAKSVKAFFVEQGIDSSRISSEGYGEDRPVASNETEEGRAKNRRVEIKPLDTPECH